MMVDLILFLGGLGILWGILWLAGNREAFRQKVMVVGGIVTMAKLLVLLGRLESVDSGYGALSLPELILAFLLEFRPLLLGILLHLVLGLVSAVHSSATPSSPESTGLPPADPPFPLSRRELEVARLAAQDYTNAQIAEELYISVSTVKRHLATIFEKLEIHSRRQLKSALEAASSSSHGL